MGLPASLLTDLSELRKAAEPRPLGEASAKDEWLAATARVAAQTAQLQKRADGILSQLERVAEVLAAEHLEDLDKILDGLQKA
ncbi:MAG TPA: hypothetical protein VGR07_05825, partial [Thermoanaerobaculia bacterium]|nr:hypothetical protein [Thermoanaerobaculia bacterium]